jgi:intron-binding protein aquarius
LVTHSNQALNQLFDKLVELDIDERHLLRLGHGEEYLESTKDFSKYGRVNYMLAKRLDLLKEVERLGKTLGMTEDVAYTCETAEYFFNSHVKPLWQSFEEKAKEFKGEDSVATNFPFTKFFANAPQPLFKQSLQEDMRTATGCWRHINNLFVELGECRPFELLRTPIDRANYLVTKQAKVVAMTCTHAAIKREELVNLGFKYDNLLMEEAAQILEIETFIPMLLQGHDQREGVRLKRVVLIGDHHQLPPIIKNMAFQKYSHMDQVI